MKVAIIRNRDVSGVLNTLGMQNKEFYNERTVGMVAASLEKAGHNVAVLDGNMYIIERLQNFMPRVSADHMGMVFNMAYGIQGESRYTHIPSMLEMLGIPYIGSAPAGHALALDKVMTKMIWQSSGLPTPEFWVFNSKKDDVSGVTYPAIVKPKMESVSFGLKVVHNETDLREAIDFVAAEYNQSVLVERFIRGREFCVGLLGNNPIECFPVLEIDLEGNPDGIQTENDKRQKPLGKLCPAPLEEDVAIRMTELSKRAFSALNLRDFARVDIRMDEQGGIHLLEVNSMASLGQSGSYPFAAQAAGYDYTALINKMLDVATLRYFSVRPIISNFHQQGAKKLNLNARLRTFLRGKQSQLEALLRKLVNVNTFNQDTSNVNLAASMIAEEFSALGFVSEVQPQLDSGNQYYFTNCANGTPDVVFLVSLDGSVRMGSQQNFHETEHRLYGTGIWENKSGAVVVLGALQALRFARMLKKIKVGVVMTTDNTLHGKFSRLLVEQKCRYAGMVLATHGAGATGGLVLSRSGAATYRYRLSIVESASAEDIGDVARYFVKTILSILDISKKNPEELVAPYEMNFDSNLFKGQAIGVSKISARFNSVENFEQMDAKIREVTKLPSRLRKKVEIRLTGGLHRPPLVTSEQSTALYDNFLRLASELTLSLESEHRWSSSDICVVDDSVPRLDGLGPAGGYDHDREYILRSSLPDKALLVAAMLAKDFAGK